MVDLDIDQYLASRASAAATWQSLGDGNARIEVWIL